jgi:hypothetical protein
MFKIVKRTHITQKHSNLRLCPIHAVSGCLKILFGKNIRNAFIEASNRFVGIILEGIQSFHGLRSGIS